jgi:hypothetical protein
MNENQIELITEILVGMKGNYYDYGRTQHRIVSFRIDEARERVYIMTDKKEYDRDFDSVLEFLNLFEATDARPLPAAKQQDAGITVTGTKLETVSAFGELRTVLMDNIRKVQQDKNYIPQAESILTSVSGMIDLAKTEVAYMEAFTRMRKNGEI